VYYSLEFFRSPDVSVDDFSPESVVELSPSTGKKLVYKYSTKLYKKQRSECYVQNVRFHVDYIINNYWIDKYLT
jgi:hypothetical protein